MQKKKVNEKQKGGEDVKRKNRKEDGKNKVKKKKSRRGRYRRR